MSEHLHLVEFRAGSKETPGGKCNKAMFAFQNYTTKPRKHITSKYLKETKVKQILGWDTFWNTLENMRILAMIQNFTSK